jgi:P27 family predicted phage terminase small subunit
MKTKIPQKLSVEARGLWQKLAKEYQIEDQGGLAVLQVACEALDRLRAAQAGIKKDGMTFTDRFGQVRINPLTSVERDSRAQYLQALKALNLDLEPLKDRPGRPGGR